MADLLQFLAARIGGEEFDNVLGFGVVIAGLSSRVQVPAQTRAIANRPDQQGGVFDEAVVGDQKY